MYAHATGTPTGGGVGGGERGGSVRSGRVFHVPRRGEAVPRHGSESGRTPLAWNKPSAPTSPLPRHRPQLLCLVAAICSSIQVLILYLKKEFVLKNFC